mmetsp:Transcript_665/g.3090  ORF Transcript_665/g.3090 Transcript_665/m.3090 type:complete len:394 (-) Transcript_665:565-1746(-)
MVLEATMLCIDNSEHVRNSDYLPSRLQAEGDAINLLAGAKTQSNPENSVGVMSLAGKVPRVIVTPTDDLGQVLNAVHGISTGGSINLSTGVQVAHLALKHRQNKHQRMRIVLFVGSPVTASKDELTTVGKKLRKCNVAVDVISFGDIEKNSEKLEAFVAAVNKNSNSNMVTVPPGAIIADVMLSTRVFMDDDNAANGSSGFAAAAAAASSQAAARGYAGDDAGFDGADDPALMLALRVSLEEERARQEAQMKDADDAINGNSALAQFDCTQDTKQKPCPNGVPLALDEDALLQRAFALSMSDERDASASKTENDNQNIGTVPSTAFKIATREDTESVVASDLLGHAPYADSIISSLPAVDVDDEEKMLREARRSQQEAEHSKPSEDVKEDGHK